MRHRRPFIRITTRPDSKARTHYILPLFSHTPLASFLYIRILFSTLYTHTHDIESPSTHEQLELQCLSPACQKCMALAHPQKRRDTKHARERCNKSKNHVRMCQIFIPSPSLCSTPPILFFLSLSSFVFSSESIAVNS